MSNKKLNNKGITIVEAVISMALLIVLICFKITPPLNLNIMYPYYNIF